MATAMSNLSSGGGKSPMGGGAPLAGLILLGTLIGVFFGQPSIGILAGAAAGIAVALFVWWKGSR